MEYSVFQLDKLEISLPNEVLWQVENGPLLLGKKSAENVKIINEKQHDSYTRQTTYKLWLTLYVWQGRKKKQHWVYNSG